MNPKLHTLLILAAAFATDAVHAQENPPPPQRPDAPVYPPEPPRRADEPRRPEAERPRGDERRRPDGERPPGTEPRRGPSPGDGNRRDAEPRGEGERRPIPMQPPAAQRMRPYLGIVTSPAPAAVAAQAGLPEGFGLVVDEVLPDSPAKTAGIERYDVLTKFDDQKLVDPAQLAALVGVAAKDAVVAVTLLRRGQEQKVTVKVGEKMLPDRQSAPARSPLPDLRDLWRRYGDSAAPLTERVEDAGRKAQELSREFQRRMQEFQEKIEQWRKNPSGKFPEPPKFPDLGPTRSPGSVPRDLLREARPGGAPTVQRSDRGTTSTWSTADANVSIKDDDGEIAVRSENGRRTLIAKDASGAVTFDGPIDTDEQRQRLPDSVRRKLDRIDVHSRNEPPKAAPEQKPDVQ